MELLVHDSDSSADQSIAFGSARAAKHKEHCQRFIVQRLRDGMTLAVWPGRARLYKGHRMHSPCYLPAAKALIAEGGVLPIGQTFDQRGILYGLAALTDTALYPVVTDDDDEMEATVSALDAATLALVDTAGTIDPADDDDELDDRDDQ